MSKAHLPSVIPTKISSNKGCIIGQKRPLLPKHVWAIRVRLELAGNLRDLANAEPLPSSCPAPIWNRRLIDWSGEKCQSSAADGVPVHTARWIRLQIGERPAWALSYVINRKGPSYAGRLTLAEVADLFSSSYGYAGSCAEYFHQTVTQLRARGIHDSRRWRLQELVAERLEQMQVLDHSATTFGDALR